MNDFENKIITFLIGVLIGGLLMAVIPRIEKSDVESAKVQLEEFNRVEEVCGKGNVRSKCKYGLCDNDFGLTCYSLRKAAFEAEKKKDNNE